MGITNFPNGVSSFGIPLVGGAGLPTTFGDFFFVDYSNGSDSYSVKSNSIKRPFKTIDKAYGLTTTNKNDVIALAAYGEHVLTEMLTVSKSRVHFIGMDCAGRMYGQGARIGLTTTGVATDIATIKNTGVRNSFQNIKISNTDATATALYCFIDAGEYTYMDRCEIYKSTILTDTAAAELVCNGDSSMYVNCTIGSTVNAIVGAIIRPNVLISRETITGKVCRDVTFRNCVFLKKAGNVANRFVYGSGATDAERMLLFDGCLFFSTKLSSAVPAQCVAFGAEQTEGYCLIRNCDSVGNTKLSTTTGVYITGAVPTYATSGIAVAS